MHAAVLRVACDAVSHVALTKTVIKTFVDIVCMNVVDVLVYLAKIFRFEANGTL